MRRLTGLIAAVAVAACGDNIQRAEPDAAPDAPPDTAPVDAPPPTLGPSLVLDDIHIAGLFEDPHAFSLLGQVLDPQLASAIEMGTLLLALELRELDDPTGQDDPELTVAMYALTDPDGDPSDNFDPDAPETFALAPGSVVDGEPAIHFTTASIAGRSLNAEGVDSLDLLGELFPLPISNLEIEGDLVADDTIRELTDGRLRGALAASALSLAPNITEGMCAGDSLLDVLVTGCGVFPLQPDIDLDDDGLETMSDDDGDGAIDRCVDGDGTQILGTDCPRDPAIADGYQWIMVIHGVRAVILE